MHDAVMCKIVTNYTALCSVKFKIPLYISPDVAQLGTRLDCNPEDASSSPHFCLYFSYSNVRLLAYV